MTIELNTILPSSLFSSAIPDLVFSITDGEKANFQIWFDRTIVFSVSLYPYEGKVILTDLRSVIEDYMKSNNLCYGSISILSKDFDGKVESILFAKNFDVLFCSLENPNNIALFTSYRYLTTLTSKLSNRYEQEYLSYYMSANETSKIIVDAVVRRSGESPFSIRLDYGETHTETATVKEFLINYSDVLDRGKLATSSDIEILSYSVKIGKRSFTFYVEDVQKFDTFVFRNCFNIRECFTPKGVTTTKAKIDRSIAVINNRSVLYDQTNTQEFEVSISGITQDDEEWLEQLLYSHNVQLLKDNEVKEILITEINCDISNSAIDMNSAKFTYQYSSILPQLKKIDIKTDNVFTEQYQDEFR